MKNNIDDFHGCKESNKLMYTDVLQVRHSLLCGERFESAS